MPLGRLDHRYRVLAVCAAGIFIAVFDTSSSIVALPTLAAELATDLPTAQWVILGNALTIAVLLVPMGRLSDLIGRKRIYVLGCCLFALGALLGAFTSSIYALIGARVFVGIGSAMTQGTATAILIGNFDVTERARVLGMQMTGVGLGAIAGPSLGGFIVGTAGWRALFVITAITMLVIAIAAQRTLKRRAKRPPQTGPVFDFRGALLFSTFLAAGLLTLTHAPEAGWLSIETLGGSGLCAAALAAFIVVERRQREPMLDLALFRNGTFALGSLSAVVVFMGISAMRFLAPFFLQSVRGFSPAQVGLLLLPGAVVTAVASPFAGRLADRFGVRLFATVGFGVTTAGLFAFAVLDTATPAWFMVGSLMILALGMSAFSAPNSASIINSVDADSHGLAAGFVNLCRNTGNVLGIAFGTAVVTLMMARAGMPPSLAAIDEAAGQTVFTAFTSGVRTAAIALIALALPVLAILARSVNARAPAAPRR
ncbi:MAG TPA: MFS transporter [Gammaproteobacteria bacterium]|jgi:EmrB/QacA subfamily drug resistance transporter